MRRVLRRWPGAVLVAAAMSAVWMGAAGPATADDPTGPAHADLPVDYNFFSGIPGELAHPGGSLPGSNDWNCRPSAEHPNPVVLVHGTGGGAQTNWGVQVPLLANEGYCVYSLTYGALDLPWPISAIGGMGPIEQSAQQVSDFVDRVLASTGADRVDLIAHSQGNLVGNYFVKRLGGDTKVDKFVALAAPWLGTYDSQIDPVRAAAGQLGGEAAMDGMITAVSAGACRACSEMFGTSRFIRDLDADGVYDPAVTYTNIESQYDEAVVPASSALVPGPGVTNILLQDGCAEDYSEHAGLVGSDRTAAFTLNALDPEHPRPVPCHFIPPFVG